MTGLSLKGSGSGIDGLMAVELVALSPRRTRISVALNLSPTGLTGRLLLQSLKLARGKLNKRFKLRLADYARLTEERLNSTV